MGWLRDGMEDEGGIFFDLEQRDIEEERVSDILEDRKKRVKDLEGKYIVGSTGASSGHQVFYQRGLVKKGRYWTRFLSNAKGFTSLQDAEKLKNTFKYGNPRIAIVKDGSYKWV